MKSIAVIALMALITTCCASESYSVLSGSPVYVVSDNETISSGIEPTNINFSGEGQEASQIFTLTKGLSIFSMKHIGSSNFAVWLLDDNGNNVDLLVNVIGGFDGAKAVGIPKQGNYVLDISADGPWTIDISQPRPQNAQSIPVSFSGVGQQVSQFFLLKPGLTRFEMVHDGTRNFAIWLLDETGNNVDLLVNEIGVFDGSKAIGIKREGIYCLGIGADGNWQINISQ